MNTVECLKELYDIEMDRAFDASANYAMTMPARGRETDFACPSVVGRAPG